MSTLAQVITVLPEFAHHVMGDTETPAGHHAVSGRLIVLGQATSKRTGSVAVTRALSALVDMTDVLSGIPGALSVANVLSGGWCEWLG